MEGLPISVLASSAEALSPKLQRSLITHLYASMTREQQIKLLTILLNTCAPF
jgi:hypothetical protein